MWISLTFPISYFVAALVAADDAVGSPVAAAYKAPPAVASAVTHVPVGDSVPDPFAADGDDNHFSAPAASLGLASLPH